MSLLESRRGEIQPLPMEVFPPAWRAWIEDTAQGAGAPVDYVALALLASTAAVVGCGMRVRAIATWHEPLILWVAVVGGPSTGKSPALGAARRLLDRIELEMRLGDEVRLREHSQCVEIANARTAKWQLEIKEAIKNGLAPPDMPADAMAPEPFVPRQVIVTDTTIEAVADILRGNPRGIILWRDELSAWIGNMSRYSGGSDQAQWLEAWPAARLTVNRKNRPPVLVPHFAASILGGLQPDKLAEILAGADDGLAARFLFGWPGPAPHVRPSLRRGGLDDDALERLRWIEGVSGTAEEPRTIELDANARGLFDEFSTEHHADAQDLEGFEAGFFGKGMGHVLRLAGVLALLEASEDDGRPPVISADIFSQAAGLWRGYFWPHARVALNVVGGPPRRRMERRVLVWLRARGLLNVSREGVRRDALGQDLNAAETSALMGRLVRAGWVREATSTREGPGRPATAWDVNPVLFGVK